MIMKKLDRFTVVVLLELVCLVLSSCATNKVTGGLENGRTISSGTTTATLSRGGSSPVIVSVGDVLRSGDVLETRNGYVHIKFSDGSRVVVYPGSRIRISSFILDFGKALVEALGSFRTQTPDVSIEVEGTEYIVERRRGRQSTDVTVLEGGVYLSPKPGVGNWPRTIVKATGRCTVGKDYQRFHSPLKKNEFNRLVSDSRALFGRFPNMSPPPQRDPIDINDDFRWPFPSGGGRNPDGGERNQGGGGRDPKPGGGDPGKLKPIRPPLIDRPIRQTRIPDFPRFQPKFQATGPR